MLKVIFSGVHRFHVNKYLMLFHSVFLCFILSILGARSKFDFNFITQFNYYYPEGHLNINSEKVL